MSEEGSAEDKEASMLNISSSRISRSYFDEEMQAKVSRSSRRRLRPQSENNVLQRSHNRQDNSQLDRALLHTTRIIVRLKDFVKDKYRALVDYLYEEAPRATLGRVNRNKIMQAPTDEQHFVKDNSFFELSALSDQQQIESERNAKLEKSATRLSRWQDSFSSQEDSSGFMTAYSKSRSRSVARRHIRSRSMRPNKEHRLASQDWPQHQLVVQQNEQRAPRPTKGLRFQDSQQATSREQHQKPRYQKAKTNVQPDGYETYDDAPDKEDKSISVQAQPARRAINVQKRSVGVGSFYVDASYERTKGSQASRVSASVQTTVPSRAAKPSKVAEVEKNFVSSNAESKIEVVDSKAPEREVVAKANNSSVHTAIQPTLQAKPAITEPIAGKIESEIKAQKQTQRLAKSESQQKLQAFYQKLAEHDRLDSSGEEQKCESEAEAQMKFDPNEQDEENYQHQNENQQYFEVSSAENIILEDLCHEWLDYVSDCSFMPTNEAASHATLNRGRILQQSHGSAVTKIGVQIALWRAQSPAQSTISLFRPLAPAYQSDSETQNKRINLAPKLPIHSKERKIKRAQIISQQALYKATQAEAGKSLIQSTPSGQALINLFSTEGELKRLKEAPRVDVLEEADKVLDATDVQGCSLEPSELFYDGDKTVQMRKAMVAATLPSPLVQIQQQQHHRSENKRYESSQTTEELTLLNFELSKDISQSIMCHLGSTTAKLSVQVNGKAGRAQEQSKQATAKLELSGKTSGDRDIQELEAGSETFPPTGLLMQDLGPYDFTMKPSLATSNQEGYQNDVYDELEQISRIEQEPARDEKADTSKSVIPPASKVDPVNDFDTGPQQLSSKFDFHVPSSQEQQEHLRCQEDEGEVVFKKGSPPQKDDEQRELKTQRLLERQNRSIPCVSSHEMHRQRYALDQSKKIKAQDSFASRQAGGVTSSDMEKKHWLSSASEEEHEGERRQAQNATTSKLRHRDLIKHLPKAPLHSSLNNGPKFNLPLYGQRAQKSIRDVKYSKQESQAGDDPAETAASENQGEQSQKAHVISVSERFKASLKAFRTNKLIKAAGSAVSLNSSKQSMATLSSNSRAKSRQKDTAQ